MPMNNPATADSSLSVLGLIADASWLVQAVILILFLASIISWFMIDRKRSSFKRYANIANDFEEEFWSGGEMTRIYQKWSAEGIPEGIANIFIAGYREYNRLAQKSNVGRSDMVDGVHRSMRVALSREIDHLETNLSFLATVGSISPYVGLFGTVWGIMNSFIQLGAQQQVTIATVAPGIAEALIATAMGLFAAIPAVIAYNRFAHQAEKLTTRYEVFMEEFVSIVSRQDIVKRV